MLGIVTLAVVAQSSLPFLSPIFTDHMVLQRERPNTFWGWTTPGKRVTVTIQGRKGSGVADASGKWAVKLTPPPAGGPYQVQVSGPSNVVLNDVLVGDVWICGGQSNMEMGIGLVNNAEAEIAAADHPGVRMFLVSHATAFEPVATAPGSWAVCNSQNVTAGGWGGFSAVGYFFGRELNRKLNVPIGLVEDCWGGTIAEAWTSRGGLRPLKDFDPTLAQIDAFRKAQNTTYSQAVTDWFAKNDAGTSGQWAAPSFDASAWKTATGSASFDALGMDQFDGLVWFRREFEIPEGASLEGATLSLGKIDDMDATFVNGKAVGGFNGWDRDRNYALPNGVLQTGKNVVAVRVLDTGGGGGLYSPPSELMLKLADGKTIPLGGNWKYNVALDFKTAPAFPMDLSNNPNVPTVLYNGMISPIVPLAIKGAIWYQGESNAGRAKQYQRLLPAMIKDWRKQWGQGDFPFLIVQLANYMEAPKEPVNDDWAQLREAQAMTAKSVKNSGLAVAIDIGDAKDIHPKNKQDVGLRLALAALKVAYDREITYSGPVYKSMKREGDSIRLSFEHVANGLKLKSGDVRPVGFAIAGKDKVFRWATAEIQGNSILVRASEVPNPVAVRYAWAANPPANVYNSADLPLVPFRTDKW